MHATCFAHLILHDLVPKICLKENMDFITDIDYNNMSEKYILISYNL
jgi:hypothetical protein